MSISYKRADYLFDLPVERIAQKPATQRDASKLLVAMGSTAIRHRSFHQLGLVLRPGDVLVLNQTRVMNARCFAFKENGVRIETFILDIQTDPQHVPVLVKPAKRIKVGMVLHYPRAGVHARVTSKKGGEAVLAFEDLSQLHAVIRQDGQLPLPPYIKREKGPREADEERYQTVYARELGAVAAPTAGLHFTESLLRDLRNRDIHPVYITHHVGIGTFKPLTAEDIRDHVMESETYIIDPETASHLTRAKTRGQRIIAVGTTSTRCLEANYREEFHPGQFQTHLYIYPGYKFRAIDGLVTNFHLPGSSLILLVSALMGRERILEIYREAIASKYRFYSYGDATLLLP